MYYMTESNGVSEMATPDNVQNTHVESIVLNSDQAFNQKSVQNVCDITVHEKPVLCFGSGELPGAQGPVGPFPANGNQAGASRDNGNTTTDKLIEAMEQLMLLNAQQMQALNRQSEQAVELQRHQMEQQRYQVEALESQAAALQRQTDLQREIADASRNQQNSPKRLEIRLKDLPAFDGIDGKRIVKFFADFDRCRALGNWDNEGALTWLESCLTGIALAVFHASGPHRTIANAKQALMRRFMPDSKREAMLGQLENMRQGETESVGLYSSEIRIVTQRMKCRSLAEAVQFVEEEETRQEWHASKNRNENTEPVYGQNQNVADYSGNNQNHCAHVPDSFGENTESPRGSNPGWSRGNCYSCGQQGHIARDCNRGYY